MWNSIHVKFSSLSSSRMLNVIFGSFFIWKIYTKSNNCLAFEYVNIRLKCYSSKLKWRHENVYSVDNVQKSSRFLRMMPCKCCMQSFSFSRILFKSCDFFGKMEVFANEAEGVFLSYRSLTLHAFRRLTFCKWYLQLSFEANGVLAKGCWISGRKCKATQLSFVCSSSVTCVFDRIVCVFADAI